MQSMTYEIVFLAMQMQLFYQQTARLIFLTASRVSVSPVHRTIVTTMTWQAAHWLWRSADRNTSCERKCPGEHPEGWPAGSPRRITSLRATVMISG